MAAHVGRESQTQVRCTGRSNPDAPNPETFDLINETGEPWRPQELQQERFSDLSILQSPREPSSIVSFAEAEFENVSIA
jgi:hypothetical protein